MEVVWRFISNTKRTRVEVYLQEFNVHHGDSNKPASIVSVVLYVFVVQLYRIKVSSTFIASTLFSCLYVLFDTNTDNTN